MNRRFGMAALIPVITLLTAVPVAAQSYSTAFGIRGGGLWSSSFAPGANKDLRLDMTWNGGLEFEHWLGGGRAGFRLGGSFTNGRVLSGGREVNVYLADATLMLRLLSPRPDRLVAPYIAIGGGAVHYNWELNGFPYTDGAEVERTLDRITRPAGNVAFGLDLNPVTGVGLRLEASDYVVLKSPYTEYAALTGTGESFGPIHHLRFSGSIQFRFGGLDSDRPVLAYAPSINRAPEAPVSSPISAPEPEPRVEDDEREIAPPARVADEVVPELESMRTRIGELERALARNTARVRSLDDQLEALEDVPVRAVAGRPAADDRSPTVSGQYYTVQIAAFQKASPAQRLADSMRADGVPARVVSAVANGQTYHRVRIGAVPSASEAQRLGRWVRNTYGTKIWIAPVASGEPVTQAVVAQTRRLLRSSE